MLSEPHTPFTSMDKDIRDQSPQDAHLEPVQVSVATDPKIDKVR